jgi:hypothetical protein
MTNVDFYNLMEGTFKECLSLAKRKGLDYTKGSPDALANFKEGGHALSVDPKVVCWVFMNKHYQAITNFVRTNGQSQSEPIDGRIDDMINYLVLMKGIIHEQIEFEKAKAELPKS